MRSWRLIWLWLVAGCAVGVQAWAGRPSLEVVHWWTSGSEARALQALKEELSRLGYEWKDSPVTGGGGSTQRAVLQARVAAGNPPDIMQMHGATVSEYARDGLLGALDPVAQKEGWARLIPEPIQRFSRWKGHWVAVPVNIHRINWVWANKALFDRLQLTIPRTPGELVLLAEKVRRAGYTPLAHGGQPWQTATLFENAVMAVGGVAFYRSALVDLEPRALSGPTMVKVFAHLRQLRGMVDSSYAGRDWNFASAMVMGEKAVMQVMGDWAKGEFLKAGKRPGVDFLCFPYPGTAGTFIYTSDQFATVSVKRGQQAGQQAFASAVMDKGFQERFNLAKGSIPVRMDVPMGAFDACGQQSMRDLTQAVRRGAMVGSAAHGYAMSDGARSVVFEVVSPFFDSTRTPLEGAQQLAAALSSVKPAPRP